MWEHQEVIHREMMGVSEVLLSEADGKLSAREKDRTINKK
jgi:hypothetical protein